MTQSEPVTDVVQKTHFNFFSYKFFLFKVSFGKIKTIRTDELEMFGP